MYEHENTDEISLVVTNVRVNRFGDCWGFMLLLAHCPTLEQSSKQTLANAA